MPLIYIEYFSRRPAVELDEFHRGVAKGIGWDDGFAEDVLVLAAGRTWRLGPQPEYLIAWYTPGAGLGRLDAWDRIFRSGAADPYERPFLEVARIDYAGCYEPLLEPLRARAGLYYVEFFRARADLAAVRSFEEDRARRHHGFKLNLLAQRIGRLAPEPGGLAVWTVPDFAALEEMARSLEGVSAPLELVTAGTYVDIGREIL